MACLTRKYICVHHLVPAPHTGASAKVYMASAKPVASGTLRSTTVMAHSDMFDPNRTGVSILAGLAAALPFPPPVLMTFLSPQTPKPNPTLPLQNSTNTSHLLTAAMLNGFSDVPSLDGETIEYLKLIRSNSQPTSSENSAWRIATRPPHPVPNGASPPVCHPQQMRSATPLPPSHTPHLSASACTLPPVLAQTFPTLFVNLHATCLTMVSVTSMQQSTSSNTSKVLGPVVSSMEKHPTLTPCSKPSLTQTGLCLKDNVPYLDLS